MGNTGFPANFEQFVKTPLAALKNILFGSPFLLEKVPISFKMGPHFEKFRSPFHVGAVHLKGRWGPHVGIANLLKTNLKTIFFILLYLTVALMLLRGKSVLHYSKVKSKGEKFFLKSFTISVSDALSVAQACNITFICIYIL